MTVHTESFNTADSDTLGPDLTWSEVSGDWDVVSNGCAKVSQDTVTQFARADADVSSNDNYCQAAELQATAKIAGPATRFSASATTLYATWQVNGTSRRISKWVAGSQTDLATAAWTYAQNNVAKIEASSSTITAYQDGVQRVQTTDTSIASGTRGGFMAYQAVATAMFDSFEVGDIGGGAVTKRRYTLSTLGVG